MGNATGFELMHDRGIPEGTLSWLVNYDFARQRL
jgi:hypothetical protein